MYSDVPAEHRLLAAIIDRPELTLRVDRQLFTDSRAYIFDAMRQTFMEHGELSFEGVEKRYGEPLPPDIEIARGAKPAGLIERLSDLATKRQLINISNEITVMLNGRDFDRELIARRLQLPALTVAEDSSLTGGINEFVSDVRRKHDGTYQFIDTGLGFLNFMMGNEWPRQALSVVVGQGGGGKTALVCQSSLNMARLGIPSLFVSLEMPKSKLISRFVANMANVDGLALRRGSLSKEDLLSVDKALEELQTLPLYIIDNPEMGVEDIVYQVRLHKEMYGIEAFFVDYIQIVSRPAGMNDTVEELGYIAQQIRNVAKHEHLAAVVLAQQNRQFKGLQSILGSGRIGHIADTVFEIRLDDAVTNDERRACSIDFHKNREGPVGATNCFYRPKYLRFE